MRELCRWPFTPSTESGEKELVVYEDGSRSFAYVFDRLDFMRQKGYNADAMMDLLLNFKSLRPYMVPVNISFDLYYAIREAVTDGANPSVDEISSIDEQVIEAYQNQALASSSVPD